MHHQIVFKSEQNHTTGWQDGMRLSGWSTLDFFYDRVQKINKMLIKRFERRWVKDAQESRKWRLAGMLTVVTGSWQRSSSSSSSKWFVRLDCVCDRSFHGVIDMTLPRTSYSCYVGKNNATTGCNMCAFRECTHREHSGTSHVVALQRWPVI